MKKIKPAVSTGGGSRSLESSWFPTARKNIPFIRSACTGAAGDSVRDRFSRFIRAQPQSETFFSDLSQLYWKMFDEINSKYLSALPLSSFRTTKNCRLMHQAQDENKRGGEQTIPASADNDQTVPPCEATVLAASSSSASPATANKYRNNDRSSGCSCDDDHVDRDLVSATEKIARRLVKRSKKALQNLNEIEQLSYSVLALLSPPFTYDMQVVFSLLQPENISATIDLAQIALGRDLLQNLINYHISLFLSKQQQEQERLEEEQEAAEEVAQREKRQQLHELQDRVQTDSSSSGTTASIANQPIESEKVRNGDKGRDQQQQQQQQKPDQDDEAAVEKPSSFATKQQHLVPLPDSLVVLAMMKKRLQFRQHPQDERCSISATSAMMMMMTNASVGSREDDEENDETNNYDRNSNSNKIIDDDSLEFYFPGFTILAAKNITKDINANCENQDGAASVAASAIEDQQPKHDHEDAAQKEVKENAKAASTVFETFQRAKQRLVQEQLSLVSSDSNNFPIFSSSSTSSSSSQQQQQQNNKPYQYHFYYLAATSLSTSSSNAGSLSSSTSSPSSAATTVPGALNQGNNENLANTDGNNSNNNNNNQDDEDYVQSKKVFSSTSSSSSSSSSSSPPAPSPILSLLLIHHQQLLQETQNQQHQQQHNQTSTSTTFVSSLDRKKRFRNPFDFPNEVSNRIRYIYSVQFVRDLLPQHLDDGDAGCISVLAVHLAKWRYELFNLLCFSPMLRFPIKKQVRKMATLLRRRRGVGNQSQIEKVKSSSVDDADDNDSVEPGDEEEEQYILQQKTEKEEADELESQEQEKIEKYFVFPSSNDHNHNHNINNNNSSQTTRRCANASTKRKTLNRLEQMDDMMDLLWDSLGLLHELTSSIKNFQFPLDLKGNLLTQLCSAEVGMMEYIAWALSFLMKYKDEYQEFELGGGSRNSVATVSSSLAPLPQQHQQQLLHRRRSRLPGTGSYAVKEQGKSYLFVSRAADIVSHAMMFAPVIARQACLKQEDERPLSFFSAFSSAAAINKKNMKMTATGNGEGEGEEHEGEREQDDDDEYNPGAKHYDSANRQQRFSSGLDNNNNNNNNININNKNNNNINKNNNNKKRAIYLPDLPLLRCLLECFARETEPSALQSLHEAVVFSCVGLGLGNLAAALVSPQSEATKAQIVDYWMRPQVDVLPIPPNSNTRQNFLMGGMMMRNSFSSLNTNSNWMFGGGDDDGTNQNTMNNNNSSNNNNNNKKPLLKLSQYEEMNTFVTARLTPLELLANECRPDVPLLRRNHSLRLLGFLCGRFGADHISGLSEMLRVVETFPAHLVQGIQVANGAVLQHAAMALVSELCGSGVLAAAKAVTRDFLPLATARSASIGSSCVAAVAVAVAGDDDDDSNAEDENNTMIRTDDSASGCGDNSSKPVETKKKRKSRKSAKNNSNVNECESGDNNNDNDNSDFCPCSCACGAALKLYSETRRRRNLMSSTILHFLSVIVSVYTPHITWMARQIEIQQQQQQQQLQYNQYHPQQGFVSSRLFARNNNNNNPSQQQQQYLNLHLPFIPEPTVPGNLTREELIRSGSKIASHLLSNKTHRQLLETCVPQVIAPLELVAGGVKLFDKNDESGSSEDDEESDDDDDESHATSDEEDGDEADEADEYQFGDSEDEFGNRTKKLRTKLTVSGSSKKNTKDKNKNKNKNNPKKSKKNKNTIRSRSNSSASVAAASAILNSPSSMLNSSNSFLVSNNGNGTSGNNNHNGNGGGGLVLNLNTNHNNTNIEDESQKVDSFDALLREFDADYSAAPSFGTSSTNTAAATSLLLSNSNSNTNTNHLHLSPSLMSETILSPTNNNNNNNNTKSSTSANNSLSSSPSHAAHRHQHHQQQEQERRNALADVFDVFGVDDDDGDFENSTNPSSVVVDFAEGDGIDTAPLHQHQRSMTTTTTTKTRTTTAIPNQLPLLPSGTRRERDDSQTEKSETGPNEPPQEIG